MKKIKYTTGSPFPIGSTVLEDGVNFSVFSSNSDSIELLLFNNKDNAKPSHIIKLTKTDNKSYHYWHVFVEGIKAGQYYAYRVDGKYDPSKSLAFDKSKILIDPYAKGIYSKNYDRNSAKKHEKSSVAAAHKSVVVGVDNYNWEGDEFPKRDLSDLVIYEMHIGGFTKSPTSEIDDKIKGTYKGVIEKIPYLKSLGINAVELLPVYAFDYQDGPVNKSNYWGYSPINFFSIHNNYATKNDPIVAIEEFKDMVKAFHKEGIEVILDVVYNHTSESNYDGPTQCFRGFDNDAYYILDKNNFDYLDYTGCGNTFNSNHSIGRRMIIDSLKYWVKEMHVDGFRFDLASVLSRSEDGVPIEDAPVIWSIESEPELACTKLIAEAWDASGLYQLGVFTGEKWAEWNGEYRDDIRRFIKGDRGMVSTVASRIVGSPDIFKKNSYNVAQSIHFVTCHDGFTMNDLVSYNSKHNYDNGENNRDGANNNYSWNCGIEGKTEEADIEKLRLKQIRNLFTITLLSQGTPMILMGDEIRRTQGGNNNAYCLDNDTSWMDWSLAENNTSLLNFVKSLISITRDFDVLRYCKNIDTKKDNSVPYITWHGVSANTPDWGVNSRVLGFEYHFPDKKERLLIYMNMYWENLEFEMPKPIYGKWNLQIDTSCEHDTCRLLTNQAKINVEDRSIIVLIDK